MSPSYVLTTLTVLACLAASACSDPVHEAEVAALGPEAPGVSPGPTHRPGQPCLTCHGGEGPGNPTFVTAGTVYLNQYSPDAGSAQGAYAPLLSGTVHLIDANGLTYNATTNEVGNFYVTASAWSPTFPLGAKSSDSGIPADGCVALAADAGAYAGDISVAGPVTSSCQPIPTPMNTSIDRAGVYASCAYCHFDPPGPKSPGHVYLQ